ncbi:hypothetical protein CLOSTHATH_04811 [Hungatella hathewayi DSM 13479]|uniref:Uncharacterized protein n=1 Tax=Hungatella hathewayi DSM 13479 TaxID=566550 RepID=D3AMG1_9FIRM|nr:hypothetical protein CLOSTHATH_04811 [Hungatella hathewayi DSM 13479]
MDIALWNTYIFAEASVSMNTQYFERRTYVMASNPAGIAVTAAQDRIYGNQISFFYRMYGGTGFCYNTAELVSDQAWVGGE